MYSSKATARYYGRDDDGREYRLGRTAVFDRSRQADLEELQGLSSATYSGHDDGYGGRDYRGPNTVERRTLKPWQR